MHNQASASAESGPFPITQTFTNTTVGSEWHLGEKAKRRELNRRVELKVVY